MNDIYQEILSLRLDEELAKNLNGDPAEYRAQMDKAECSPASSSDGHHGGGELCGDENDPTEGGEADGNLGAGKKMLKAMSTVETSEPGKSAIANAETLSGAGFDVPNEEPWSGSSLGLSGDGPGATVILSEDDVDVGSMMTDTPRPLQKLAPYKGDSDLGDEDKLTRDGGDMSKGHDYGVQDRALGIAGLRRSPDVTIPWAAPAPRQASAAPQGRTWREGYVTYDTTEDERISKSLEDGTLMAEPTVNWQAPLIKSRCCHLCKSNVPAFLTVCPNCRGGAASLGEGGLVMEKSVKDAVRGPTTGDVRFPVGGLKIE